ncbi:YadA C-terminal domain-containing protein, partial [Neisseria zoodegmatis]
AAINRLTQSSSLDPKRLESVEARTAQNAAKIQQLDKKVNDLDKEVRRGLASQAALGGLFQPYNVGKLNVSAAVGGYRSETAVAVGTGFRFNEHFATKAGAAFNTKKGGSASYNVGVNFEW